MAELGLKAARRMPKIAPDSPHALHMPSHIFTRLGLWDDSIASNIASAKSAVAQAQRLHGGGGAFDQLHAIDYLVYAYLQQAKDASAQKSAGGDDGDDQAGRKPVRRGLCFRSGARALGAGAARLESGCARWRSSPHGSRGTGSATPKRWCITRKRLARPARAMRLRRAVRADEIAAIRKAMPATRDYDWSGSIGAQSEAATALIALAEGKKDEGLQLLRVRRRA